MRKKGSKKSEKGKAIAKDTVFTRREVAAEIVSKFNFPKTWCVLEPSAGSGTFVDALKSHFERVIAIDIAPARFDIEKKDFFEFNEEVDLICGNPPFSIAKQFLQKAATLCRHIVMILPQRYYQNIPANTLSQDWKVEHAELLSPNETFEGKTNINSCLLYLKRVDNYVRPKRERVAPEGFSIVTYHGTDDALKENPQADLIFWQAGPKAGKRARPEELGSGMAYGCIFQDREKLARIEQTLQIEVVAGTNGFPYITSTQIAKTLNKI